MGIRSNTLKSTLAFASFWFASAMAGAQTPSIASFNPYHGAVGDTISISGSNLDTTTEFYFNGKLSSTVTIQSASGITAVVPSGATTGKLKVVNPFGSYTTSSDFIVDGTGGGGGGTGGGEGGDSSTTVLPPNIDVPVGAMTGHPRIFIRKKDLPRYQSWATPSNPIWVSLSQLAQTGKDRMDTNQIVDYGWAGGNVSTPLESYAEVFALMSLVHPDPAVRTDFANRAHTLIMTVFNEAAKGMDDSQPFRQHNFATDNRASWYGDGFALTVDWIYDKFSPAEKAKIRSVFLRWIQECCHASTTAQEHPQPLNVYNDPQLIDTNHKIRWATNNYYTNHIREIALMSMALDDLDDVPAVAGDAPAGTLRKFIGNVMQAWLYQVSAFEKGPGAGGISPEGLGYGEISLRGVAFTLLGMHTTKVDKPAVYGSTAALLKSSFWDHELISSYLHMMSPSKVIQENWVGPTYLPLLFSDTSFYKSVDYVRVFGPLAICALNDGDTDRYARLRWMIDNMPPGGVANRSYAIQSAYDGSSASLGMMYFLSCDPNFTGQVDPHTTQPMEYFAKGLGILSSRSSWDPSASWFASKVSWNSIDHQFGDANSISFWRGGEWLTKQHVGYGSTIACSDYQNTLAIQNPGVTTVPFWMDNSDRGSQYAYDPAGDPTGISTSFGPTYAFIQANTTNLYNCPSIGANDVSHASRSTLFIKPDVLVIYDRATTGTSGRFKRFWLNTPKLATINGKSATMVTETGQQMFADTLLPKKAVLSASAAESLDGQPAQYDPMGFRLMAEDPAGPANVRFLNVVQGANPGATRLSTLLIASSAGTGFDGAVVGGTHAVLFKKSFSATVSTTTFTVPASVTHILVTGLKANTGYTVGSVPVAGGVQLTVSLGGSAMSDAGGVLIF